MRRPKPVPNMTDDEFRQLANTCAWEDGYKAVSPSIPADRSCILLTYVPRDGAQGFPASIDAERATRTLAFLRRL